MNCASTPSGDISTSQAADIQCDRRRAESILWWSLRLTCQKQQNLISNTKHGTILTFILSTVHKYIIYTQTIQYNKTTSQQNMKCRFINQTSAKLSPAHINLTASQCDDVIGKKDGWDFFVRNFKKFKFNVLQMTLGECFQTRHSVHVGTLTIIYMMVQKLHKSVGAFTDASNQTVVSIFWPPCTYV